MMILVVEDDANKANQLLEVLRTDAPGFSIEVRRSYQSGLKEANASRPALILLDMSMPTFDVSPQEKGWKTRPYAGREILLELRRKAIPSKVIVVTQFESFGEGPGSLSLDELREQLEVTFAPQYAGTIFYRSAASAWRVELGSLLRSTLGLGRPGEKL